MSSSGLVPDAPASPTASASSAGTLRPSSSSNSKSPWSSFFSQSLNLPAPPDKQGTFHIFYTPPPTPKSALIVLIHGAGSSALTWALTAQSLQQCGTLADAGLVAIDARGHGDSHIYDSAADNAARRETTDYSLAVLAADVAHVLRELQTAQAWPQLPRVMLVGHSLGGAVVSEIAASRVLGMALFAYVVVDVVEGTAVEALGHMKAYLASRPKLFDSVEDAVDWTVRSRTVRNAESAKVSVPALVVQKEGFSVFSWRTGLEWTQKYWEGWFGGMSKKFLSGRGAKMLILAGTDRLDKELMIGQMQGKFQLHVVPEAGHWVQEDVPEKMADMISDFFKRNDSETLVLPPKVSELLAMGKKV